LGNSGAIWAPKVKEKKMSTMPKGVNKKGNITANKQLWERVVKSNGRNWGFCGGKPHPISIGKGKKGHPAFCEQRHQPVKGFIKSTNLTSF